MREKYGETCAKRCYPLIKTERGGMVHRVNGWQRKISMTSIRTLPSPLVSVSTKSALSSTTSLADSSDDEDAPLDAEVRAVLWRLGKSFAEVNSTVPAAKLSGKLGIS